MVWTKDFAENCGLDTSSDEQAGLRNHQHSTESENLEVNGPA
jgi:hypothetical protein